MKNDFYSRISEKNISNIRLIFILLIIYNINVV